MNVKEAIKTIRVMLGSDVADAAVELNGTPEVVEHKHAEAVLVDDTEVYTEGELVVGATLFVKGETEDALAAPTGVHETKDGLIITVGEAGIIEAIEEKAADSVEEVEAEEKVEEEMESEEPKEEAFDAEGLLAAISDMIKDYKEYVEGVKEEMSEMKESFETIQERFNAVADMPAAQTVKKSFFEEAKAAKMAEESRFEKLAKIRAKK